MFVTSSGLTLQYRTINRGGDSIFEKVREAGFDP